MRRFYQNTTLFLYTLTSIHPLNRFNNLCEYLLCHVLVMGVTKQNIVWSYPYRVHKIIKDVPKLIKNFGMFWQIINIIGTVGTQIKTWP